MEIQKNQKVLAMLRAVWELNDEGYDVGSMKVADITARAGIGKGTAYEYFRSKEEIISGALEYDYFVQNQSLSNRLEEQESFRGALETCFYWMGENVGRKRFAAQFFQKPPHERKKEKKKKENDDSCMNEIYLMKMIVALGKKDGSIRADVTEEMAMIQVAAQLFGYFMFQEHSGTHNQEEIDAMKRFLCDNIVKSLK